MNDFNIKTLFKIIKTLNSKMNKYDLNNFFDKSLHSFNLNLNQIRSPLSKETDRSRSHTQDFLNNIENLQSPLILSKNIENDISPPINEQEPITNRLDYISVDDNGMAMRETVPSTQRSQTITLERSDRIRTKSKNRLLQEEKIKNAYIQKCMRSGVAVEELSSHHSPIRKNLTRNLTASNLRIHSKITMSTENIPLDIENQNLKEINKNLILEIKDLKNKIRKMNENTNVEYDKKHYIHNNMQHSPSFSSLEKPKNFSNHKLHNSNFSLIDDKKRKEQASQELNPLNEVIEAKSKLIKELEKRIGDLIIDKVLVEEERKIFDKKLLDMNVSFILACTEIERLHSIISYKEADNIGEIESLKLNFYRLVQEYKLNSLNYKKKVIATNNNEQVILSPLNKIS